MTVTLRDLRVTDVPGRDESRAPAVGPTWSGGHSPGRWAAPASLLALASSRQPQVTARPISVYMLVPRYTAGLPHLPALRARTPRSRSAASPPAAPPGPGVRGLLLQARRHLVVPGTTHSRRILPAYGCPVRQPQALVGVAEVVQGLSLDVPGDPPLYGFVAVLSCCTGLDL